MRYLLIDESDYKHDPLPETRNLVSALFRLEHSQTAEDIRSVLDALVEEFCLIGHVLGRIVTNLLLALSCPKPLWAAMPCVGLV